jgi:hypothetical protein
MCRYLSQGDQLIAAIDSEGPLAGRPLDEVLAWRRPDSAAGCYCDPDARQHKWGLVLETIHWALNQASDIGPQPLGNTPQASRQGNGGTNS